LVGDSFDDRWSVIDTYDFFEWISENLKTFKKLDKSTITSPQLLSQKIHLQTRGYIHFDHSCKINPGKSVHENVQDMSIIHESNQSSFMGLIIACLVLSNILLVLSFIYCFCAVGSRNPDVLKILWILVFINGIIVLGLFAATFNHLYNTSVANEHLSSEDCVDLKTAKQFQFLRKRRLLLWFGLGILLGLAFLGVLILICHRLCCWFRIIKSERVFNHFPMEILDDSVRYSTGGSMKYPFEGELRNTESEDPFMFTNSERGSDFNFWDTPDQQINEFNYSFHRN
jgi:hypothetical protein